MSTSSLSSELRIDSRNRYDFKGIVVQGNSIYGTACTAYYDDNCQQPFGETGNEVATSGCNDFSVGGGAKSMKCYFDC